MLSISHFASRSLPFVSSCETRIRWKEIFFVPRGDYSNNNLSMDKRITNVPFNIDRLSLLFYSYLSEILYLQISINHFTKRTLLSVLRLTVMKFYLRNLASKVHFAKSNQAAAYFWTILYSRATYSGYKKYFYIISTIVFIPAC